MSNPLRFLLGFILAAACAGGGGVPAEIFFGLLALSYGAFWLWIAPLPWSLVGAVIGSTHHWTSAFHGHRDAAALVRAANLRARLSLAVSLASILAGVLYAATSQPVELGTLIAVNAIWQIGFFLGYLQLMSRSETQWADERFSPTRLFARKPASRRRPGDRTGLAPRETGQDDRQ